MSDYFDSVKDNFNALPTWGKALIGVAVVGGSATLAFAVVFKKGRKSPYKEDYKAGVVYLYQPPRTKVIPNISPFSLKVETWLRLAGITYENVDIPIWLRSKEGMLPFVEYNGVEYNDSSFIIRNLTKLLKKESINSSLSAEQKAVSRAFEQMMDNSMMWSFYYVRVLEHFDVMFTEKFLGFAFPWYVRLFMSPSIIRRQVLKRMKAHGIGRHPPNEIIGIGLDDLRSISTYLSSKQFLHGDTPTQVDAVLFGYLAQIIYVPLESPHQKLINSECRNLARYCDRIKTRFWPDWDEICKTRALNTWKK